MRKNSSTAAFPPATTDGLPAMSRSSSPSSVRHTPPASRAMIVDANDLTRDILGKGDQVTLTDEQLCEIIRDNPAGQDDQCTPFILIRKKAE